MIKSLNQFEAIIGYDRSDIYKAIENLDSFYYHFEKLKASGKVRHFYPSEKTLRDIQNRLVSRVFNRIIFPHFVTGSIKGRSSTLNAKIHSGYLFHLKTDLASYFSFVSNTRVYKTLVGIGFSQDISSLITKLTTYRGHLPQGAPTSPFIANLVGLQIDYPLIELCDKNQIVYTRYVDDLTFSSRFDFQGKVDQLLAVVNACGFLYNHKKTCYKIGDIEVTGAICSCNGISATPKQMIHFKFADDPSVKRGLKCYIDYVNKIKQQKFLKSYKAKHRELVLPKSMSLQ